MWLGEYEDVPIEKIENKEVLKTGQITEESLLDLHKHTTLEEMEKLRQDGIVKTQEEILQLKMSTSDQYILNRVDRMNANAREKAYQRSRKGYAKQSSLRSLMENAEERIGSKLELLGRKALSKSQIGKRKKKMEEKHGFYVELHETDAVFRRVRGKALQEFMLEDYEKTLKSRDGASGVYLPEVQKENRYFKELSNFAAWMKFEEKMDTYRKPAKEELHRLLQYANHFEGTYENGDREKPVIRADRQAMLEIYEKQIMDNTSLRQFDYSGREEFLENYQNHYMELKALMAADKLLQDMDGAGEAYVSPKHQERAFRLKLKTLKEIYEDYTARKQIFESDYYVLFAKKDLAGKSLKELEAYRDKMKQNRELDRELEKEENELRDQMDRKEETDWESFDRMYKISTQREKLTDADLMKYLEGLISRKKCTGFKMGVSAQKLYEEMGKRELKAEYEETKREFTALLKGMGYKSADKALKADPADWVLKFRDYVFQDALIDGSKTFAELSKKVPGIWTNDYIKRMDEKFEMLYRFRASREKLDRLDRLYRPEEGSLYKQKEKEVYEQLKQKIAEAKDMMTRQFDKMEAEYQSETAIVQEVLQAQARQEQQAQERQEQPQAQQGQERQEQPQPQQ